MVEPFQTDLFGVSVLTVPVNKIWKLLGGPVNSLRILMPKQLARSLSLTSTFYSGETEQVRRNHFPNIHISEAEMKRQIAEHPVLCFSHKPENALKAFCCYFTLS